LGFGEGLLDGLSQMKNEQRGPMIDAFILHELFHDVDQNMKSVHHAGIGRAGLALEEMDYWADSFALYALINRGIRRGGVDALENLRSRVVTLIEIYLASYQIFDRMEQPGERLVRLPERRLRRYLMWHLMRARAQTLPGVKDLEQAGDVLAELLGQRPFVELAPLECVHDELNHERIVERVTDQTHLFIVMGGRLHRMPSLPGVTFADLLESVRCYDRQKRMDHIMRAVREAALELIAPWSSR
jgi:hypothetical protein